MTSRRARLLAIALSALLGPVLAASPPSNNDMSGMVPNAQQNTISSGLSTSRDQTNASDQVPNQPNIISPPANSASLNKTTPSSTQQNQTGVTSSTSDTSKNQMGTEEPSLNPTSNQTSFGSSGGNANGTGLFPTTAQQNQSDVTNATSNNFAGQTGTHDSSSSGPINQSQNQTLGSAPAPLAPPQRPATQGYVRCTNLNNLGSNNPTPDVPHVNATASYLRSLNGTCGNTAPDQNGCTMLIGLVPVGLWMCGLRNYNVSCSLAMDAVNNIAQLCHKEITFNMTTPAWNGTQGTAWVGNEGLYVGVTFYDGSYGSAAAAAAA